MDNVSSLFIVIVIVSGIGLITLLVTLFYKPGKELKVDASYINDPEEKEKTCVEFHIVNIGRKRVKMATPFVRFYNGKHSMLFEIKKSYTSCKFPKIIPVGEEMRCRFDIDHFKEVLQHKSFHPQHVKIVIRDTVGMKFKSNSLDFEV